MYNPSEIERKGQARQKFLQRKGFAVLLRLSMSSSALVLPIELPMLALHTSVFFVTVKLAYQGDNKFKVFYTLYSLQNLSELLGYFSVRSRKSKVPKCCATRPSGRLPNAPVNQRDLCFVSLSKQRRRIVVRDNVATAQYLGDVHTSSSLNGNYSAEHAGEYARQSSNEIGIFLHVLHARCALHDRPRSLPRGYPSRAAQMGVSKCSDSVLKAKFQLKSSTNAALPVCFAAISALISAILNSLDVTIYLRTGDTMRLVARSEALHVV